MTDEYQVVDEVTRETADGKRVLAYGAARLNAAATVEEKHE